MSEAFPEADGTERQDAERLHAVMDRATLHLGAVRVDPARLRRAQRRHRLAEGGVVAGVLSVALVAATVAMHGGGGGTGKLSNTTGPASSTSTSAAPTSQTPANLVLPKAVSVYDSDSGSEGAATVNRLLSGTGAWETNQYCSPFATYAGLRKRTGVVFDLGSPTRIADATVSIGIPGADVEMWVADPSVQSAPAVRPGQAPAGFTKVAAAADAGTTAALSPAQPVTTRFVLVWFTGLLPAVANPSPHIHCAHSDGHLYGDSITGVRFSRG
jgi:putative peptidoglycan lipid II flippase